MFPLAITRYEVDSVSDDVLFNYLLSQKTETINQVQCSKSKNYFEIFSFLIILKYFAIHKIENDR